MCEIATLHGEDAINNKSNVLSFIIVLSRTEWNIFVASCWTFIIELLMCRKETPVVFYLHMLFPSPSWTRSTERSGILWLSSLKWWTEMPTQALKSCTGRHNFLWVCCLVVGYILYWLISVQSLFLYQNQSNNLSWLSFLRKTKLFKTFSKGMQYLLILG